MPNRWNSRETRPDDDNYDSGYDLGPDYVTFVLIAVLALLIIIIVVTLCIPPGGY